MAEATSDEGSPSGLGAVLEAVVADQFRAHPALARANGDHSADGLVSPAGQNVQDARVLELLRFRGLLAGDTGAPTAELRLDLDIARSVVDSELFDLQIRQRYLKDPTALLDSDSPLEIGGYLLRDYAPLPDRLAGLCRQLEQAREWTEEALGAMNQYLAAPLIELALQGAEGHLNFLRGDVAAVSREVDDRSLRSRLTAAVGAGEESLVRIVDELQRRRKQDYQEVGLGATGLQSMLLAQEGLDLSVSELRQQADHELESLREQRDRLLRDSFADQNVGAVRKQLEEDHFTESGLISGTSGLLRELRDFVERHGEVPIPDGPPCEVRATPGFLTAWVSAAYEGVGPLETAPLPCIYYVTTPQPSWSRTQVDEWLRYLNRGTLKNTSVHEVYPGHHVQHLYAQSLRADVRRFFWTSGFGEGWAHYAELLMIEAGLAEGHPLLQLAQIEDALLRACRYRNAVGIHAEGWSVEEGTRFFMERIGIDELPAHREAARAAIDPLYLVYTLGKLQILGWRKEWLSSNRGDLRSFHRRVLGAGSPPLAALGRWLHSQ
ncbi:MAG: DUF885 domain-containing protein [Candidatus Dormiibacterota bacterium]